jgi:DNA-binding LytR/AlgR family response regulator
VFATAYDAHALRAFDLAAIDYLLKPIAKDRLRVSLERVRATRVPGADLAQAVLSRMGTRNQRMAVRSGAKYVVFDTDRIAAILAQDHYATILVDGRELLSEESLDKLMNRLNDEKFLRVHRGAILNVTFVQELVQEGDRKYVALLAGVAGTRVPISREKLDEVKARLGII